MKDYADRIAQHELDEIEPSACFDCGAHPETLYYYADERGPDNEWIYCSDCIGEAIGGEEMESMISAGTMGWVNQVNI